EDALEEVLHPTRAASEVELQVGSHDAPAQSRSPAHRSVGVSDAQHVLLEEVENLLVESDLEPVGHMARELLLEQNGLLADLRVELHRPLDGVGRGLGACHNFNQRNDVRRMEGM